MSTRTLLACPNCQATLDIRSERLGSELECKACHHKFLASAPPADEAKVEVECPGCHRELKVRPRYLGQKVVCTHCDHPFLARPKTLDEPKQASPGEIEELRRSIDDLDRTLKESEFNAGSTIERLEKIEQILEEASLRDSARDSAIERAGLRSDQQSQDLGTIRAEVDGLREQEEARRRDFLAEVLAALEQDREGSRVRQEAMGAEIEALRARNADLERRAVEAEAAEAQRVAASDQIQALLGDLAGQVEASRAALSEVRADQFVDRGTVADHEGRHQMLQSGLARLEGLGLSEALGRLATLESENAALGQAWQSLKSEQDRMRQEVTADSDRTRAESAALLASLEALRPLAPAPGATSPATPAPRPSAEIDQSDIDLMAQDLILNRLVSPTDSSDITLSIPLVKPPVSSINITPAISEAEFTRLGDKYAELMSQQKYDEAIKTARSVVDFTLDHTGDLGLKHALWLRNLGIGLLKRGDHPQAQTSFHRALEICQDTAHANRSPHAICLLDLADAYFLAGDRAKAAAFCQTATEVLESVGGPDHPLSQRARASLHRIKTGELSPSPTGTVYLTT